MVAPNARGVDRSTVFSELVQVVSASAALLRHPVAADTGAFDAAPAQEVSVDEYVTLTQQVMPTTIDSDQVTAIKK
jgi:hypothetical protein